MSIGVPLKLFHEAKNHVVTVELKSNELYRGHLIEVDDTMNCLLENCQYTGKDGNKKYFDKIYIRGSQIQFVLIPDMFKNAPMFKRIKNLARMKNEGDLRDKARKVREQVLAQLAPE